MKIEFMPFRGEMIPDAGKLPAERDVAYRFAKKVSPMIIWAKDE